MATHRTEHQSVIYVCRHPAELPLSWLDINISFNLLTGLFQDSVSHDEHHQYRQRFHQRLLLHSKFVHDVFPTLQTRWGGSETLGPIAGGPQGANAGSSVVCSFPLFEFSHWRLYRVCRGCGPGISSPLHILRLRGWRGCLGPGPGSGFTSPVCKHLS